MLEEIFSCYIQGIDEPLKFVVKGRVIGPTFYLNVNELNFGDVSYGFKNTQEMTMVSASAIGLDFTLDVPQDHHNEFVVEPRSGTVPANGSIVVAISFTANSLRRYDGYVLVVDADYAQQNLVSIPIHLNTAIPTIDTKTPLLDFGKCFLNFPATREIELSNKSSLMAKFQFQPQEADQDIVEYYTGSEEGAAQGANGNILPYSTVVVPLVVRAKTLGHQSVSVLARIVGCDVPQECQVVFDGTGPSMKLERPSIEFGSISVLKHTTKTMCLTNDRFATVPVISLESKMYTYMYIYIYINKNNEGILDVSTLHC